MSLFLQVNDESRDHVIAELWEQGTLGITEEGSGLRAFFKDDRDTEELLATFEAFQPSLMREDDRDWVADVKAAWPSTEVGDRWFLVPEWSDEQAPPGRTRLTIFPGMASGSGWHSATRLCLEAMERVDLEQQRVLDLGTGSGILAHAASLSGARSIGCDIDHDSTMVAAENTRRYGLPVGFFTGSLRSVRAGSVDVLVANINAATIEQLALEFNRVSPAHMILAGFREDEVERVLNAVGRQASTMLEENGWACVVISG